MCHTLYKYFETNLEKEASTQTIACRTLKKTKNKKTIASIFVIKLINKMHQLFKFYIYISTTTFFSHKPAPTPFLHFSIVAH